LLGGRAALDAGWLLVVILAVALACAAGIAVRRVLIERRGGSVDCALRRGTDRHWRLGVAAYRGYARRGLAVVSRRPADDTETTSLGPGAVVVECDTADGAAHIELALSEGALTGFLAWLEAAPPGPVTEFR
jgi:hypothetical protein